MKTVHLFIRTLSTGFIFFFYSELLFWARVWPEDSIGNWLSDWSPVEEFSAGRRPTLIVSGLFLLDFVFVTIPAQPLAALILPLLPGLVYLGLRWNRKVETEGSESITKTVPVWKYASLLSIPVCATAVYISASLLDLHWRTNWVLYLITTPAGFILFDF